MSSTSPHTNVGSEAPLMDVERLRWSTILSFCTAESVPSQIPSTRMQANEYSASSNVAGK